MHGAKRPGVGDRSGWRWCSWCTSVGSIPITRRIVCVDAGLNTPRTSWFMTIRWSWSRASGVERTHSRPADSSTFGWTSLSTGSCVPVMPTRRKPRAAASAATTSAICSQGSSERGKTQGNATCRVIAGRIRKSAPIDAGLRSEPSINSPTPDRSSRARHATYTRERRRVHRDLRMAIRAERPGTVAADRSIAKGGAFGGTADDSDVDWHEEAPREPFDRRTRCSYLNHTVKPYG